MAIILTQVVFSKTSGIPADQVVNTFHHSTAVAVPTAAELDALHAQIVDFYVGPTGPSPQVQSFLSRFLASTVNVKSYNLSLPIPRSPIKVSTFGITPSTATPLPSEVAAVLSYRSEPASGVPLASSRGRLYIGPLSTTAQDVGSVDVTLNAGIRTGLGSAAIRMVNAGKTGTQPVWVVFSPTRRARGQSPDALAVSRGFIDDAFDTQRRRGPKPSVRSVWVPAA